jgi:hypothetical protein
MRERLFLKNLRKIFSWLTSIELNWIAIGGAEEKRVTSVDVGIPCLDVGVP